MLNVAIVGAGMMGRMHGNRYAHVKGAKVTSVCDLDGEKAKMLADAINARIWTDFDSMINQEKIDIVDICLPTYLHKEVALESIKANKHVFCEKPIARCLEDARQMAEEARKKNIKFSVGQVVRFFPPYSRASRMISEGKIGMPRLVRTTRTGAFPLQGAQNWYGNYELSGGVLLDLAVHDFDWIRHNFGDVERVYAKSLAQRNLDCMDHCLAILRLKNGMVAHVEGSWAYPQGSIFGTTFEIIGTKGQIEYDSRVSVPLKKHIKMEDSEKIIVENPLFPCDDPYTALLQDFVDSIVEDREPAVSPEDAIKAIEISLAAIESSLSGEAVVLGGNEK